MMRGRWLVLWLGIVGWVAVPVLWLSTDRRMASEAFEAFSTYNTSPGGMSLAFGYLRQTRGLRNVERLIRTLDVNNVAVPATIFRVGATESFLIDLERMRREIEEEGEDDQQQKKPAASEEKPENERNQSEPRGEPARAKEKEKKQETRDVFPLLADEEEQWIRNGGRLVLAFTGPYVQLNAQPIECGEFRQVYPGALIPKIEVPSCRAIRGEGLRQFHTLLVSGNEPVMMRSRIGRGEVIALSLPEVLSNEYLGKAGHLALLEQLAGRGPVYFDETVHGAWAESSILELLTTWGFGPALLLFLVAALLEFWRRARRLGQADRAEKDTRSDAIDLVDALGQLYDRSLDREAALRMYYETLRRAVHARTGLSGEALERTVREKTGGYVPRPHMHDISRDEFQRNLKILNGAYETVIYGQTR